MTAAYARLHGWRWVGWYLRHGRLLAALRQFVGAYVLGDDGERCQDCGRSYVLWHADDDLYDLVTGRSSNGAPASGLFCPSCFDRMAGRRGIDLRWIPKEITR